MKKASKKKIDTIEKLAQVISVSFDDLQTEMEARFISLETETKNGFQELRKILDRVDTRLAALELAVFGATLSGSRRLAADSFLSRLDKLEKAVFLK